MSESAATVQPAEPARSGRLRLPCGRTVTRLWELLDLRDQDTPPTRSHRVLEDHVHGCPHCTAELSRLRELRALTTALAQDAPRAPEGLWSRVMSVVRTELRSGPDLMLVPGDPRAVVATAAVTRVVRRSLQSQPEIRSVGRISVTAEDGAGLVVTVRITGSPTAPAGLADSAADALRVGLADAVGATVIRVDVSVEADAGQEQIDG